jgi:hypothetical protein
MPIGLQAAQAFHAGVQWYKENPDHEWQNDFVVLLEVKDVNKWIYKLDHLGEKYTTFTEPDQNFKVTAIATPADGKYFTKLPLLGSRKAS